MDIVEFKDMVMAAIDKLEKQGVPSTRDSSCYYLDKETGHCCIVGHIMPDDKTRELADKCENAGVIGLLEDGFEWLGNFTYEQTMLLQELQEVHDSVEFGKSVFYACKKMRKLVEKFK